MDPLEALADVAAAAPRQAKAKRKQALKAGRDVCFCEGCDCTEGLCAVPKVKRDPTSAYHVKTHTGTVEVAYATHGCCAGHGSRAAPLQSMLLVS